MVFLHEIPESPMPCVNASHDQLEDRPTAAGLPWRDTTGRATLIYHYEGWPNVFIMRRPSRRRNRLRPRPWVGQRAKTGGRNRRAAGGPSEID
jgi:hypothetical protein